MRSLRSRSCVLCVVALASAARSRLPAKPNKKPPACQEMVDLFNIAYAPSLASRHIEAKAIDMTITWSGTLKVKNKSGVVVQVTTPRSGDENTTLHAVGATYGVVKLKTDPPHWSVDGH